MAKRKIPTNMQPWTANINGEEYEYESGTTAEVPDEVAALIDFIDESAPKRDPKAAQRAIEDEVTQIVKDNFAGGVGYEETSEVVMLPETSFDVSGGSNMISDSFPYTFEVGKEYTVTLDGETKTYTAVDASVFDTPAPAIPMSDHKIYILAYRGSVGVFADSEPFLGTHTISISDVTTTTHKIDRKYRSQESMPLYITSSGLSLTSGGAAIEPEELADLLKNFECYVIDIVNNHKYDEYIAILSVKAYHKNGNLVAVVCSCIRNGSITGFTNGTVPIS